MEYYKALMDHYLQSNIIKFLLIIFIINNHFKIINKNISGLAYCDDLVLFFLFCEGKWLKTILYNQLHSIFYIIKNQHRENRRYIFLKKIRSMKKFKF